LPIAGLTQNDVTNWKQQTRTGKTVWRLVVLLLYYMTLWGLFSILNFIQQETYGRAMLRWSGGTTPDKWNSAASHANISQERKHY